MLDLKKVKLSKLKEKIDKEFSLYIRRRDSFKCVTCGLQGKEGDGVMQAGHLFTRTYLSTRWDEVNTSCQCKNCNFRHEFDWEPYRNWFVNHHSQEEYTRLYLKHRTVKKYTRGELIALLDHYKNLNKREIYEPVDFNNTDLP